MAGRYAVQVSCTLNGVRQKFLLDTVNETKIDTKSELSSHPIAQGDYISDHMYRTQTVISLDGSYSLNSGSTTNKTSSKNMLFEQKNNNNKKVKR